MALFKHWHLGIWGKMLHRKKGPDLSFPPSLYFDFKIHLFHEVSMLPITNLNSYCGSSIIYLCCDLLSQHLECAAANGNVGGISIEGFAFSIAYWNPKTKNEPKENSSALLCIRLWPMSNSKDPGLISQFCTCTPANLFNICSDKCVGIWGLDSDLKLIFTSIN